MPVTHKVLHSSGEVIRGLEKTPNGLIAVNSPKEYKRYMTERSTAEELRELRESLQQLLETINKGK